MSDWIDIIGSFVVGSIVVLILLNLKISINAAASENLYSGIVQRNVTSAAELLEHDLYKIGFRISGDKIIVADSNEIKFYTDINNNGVDDEIHYYCDKPEDLTSTRNPSDYLLTREKNKEKPGALIVVVDFKLSYYDSLGQKIDYTALQNQSEMNKIRTVGVRLKCETAEKIYEHYEAVEWEKTIKPKNI